nr:hypothetical protein [Tanacetum cinerariifolium]
MVEGTKNVDTNKLVDESENTQLNNQEVLDTRLDPMIYKKNPNVEIIADVPVNVIKEEEDSIENDYKLRQMKKGKHVEESRNTPSFTPIRSPRIHSTLIYLDIEKIQELTETDPKPSSYTPSPSSPKPTLSMSQHILKKFNVLAQHFQEVMKESLPNMVADRVKELTKTQVKLYVEKGLIMERKHNQVDVEKMIADVDSSIRNYMSDNPQLQHDDLPIRLALKIKFDGLHASNTPCRSYAIHPRDQDNPHDDACPKVENSAKRKKTYEHKTYVFGKISSYQVNESEPGSSTSGNQEQLDDFDFWTHTYTTYDDGLPAEKVPQEIVKEISQIIDGEKLHKVVNEMMRQRCTSGDEHQYHINQMHNFLKNDIVWESRKEILTSPFPPKPTPVVQSCKRDHKAPAPSLVNQDLLYLKKGNSGPEKFMYLYISVMRLSFLMMILKKENPYG